MKKFFKFLAIGMGFVLCFGAGAFAYAFVFSHRASDFNKYEQILSILENNWYYADQIENIEDKFLGYAVSGNTIEVNDPYTQYLSNEQATNLNLKLEGKSAGIGVLYRPSEDGIVLNRVYVNSPADQAGLETGDIIVSIDGMEINEENVQSIPEYISNAEVITVVADRNGEIIETQIKPSDFDSTVSLDLEEDYGYVKISSFSSETGVDFYDALKRVNAEDLETLVLDLRGNTGGTTDAAIAVASSLLEQGSVVYQEQYPDGSIEQYITKKGYSPVEFENIVILQDDDTASSSEIVIGALKDYLGDSVVTIGQTSYGKGSVQYYFPFEDGTSLKFTRALWLTPSGNSINQVGITPDIEVESLIPSISYYGNDPVEPDTANIDAAALQQMLAYLGYEVARTDNYYPVESAQALMAFQSDNGLNPDGIGDEETFEVLIEKFAQKASEDYRDAELDTAIEWISSRN